VVLLEAVIENMSAWAVPTTASSEKTIQVLLRGRILSSFQNQSGGRLRTNSSPQPRNKQATIDQVQINAEESVPAH
jgi:hypothetical protein